MIKISRKTLVASISTLALTPLIASAAWVGPTAAPPGNNVEAPINVGNVDQVKNGGIGLNSLAVFGNSLFGGSTGSNAYMNFGTTSGSNGYGIRDNAGLLEFKNSGGDWASIQSTIYNLVVGAASWAASGNDIYNTNSGNVGIGTAIPSAKLEVAGQVKITGGSPGAGKVLTSDSSGLASWATPSSGWQVIYQTCSGATCSAGCPAGKKATGGGCVLINGGGNLQDSYGGESSWTCDYNGSINTVRAQVYCVNI